MIFILQNVSGEYLEIVSNTVAKLDMDINKALRVTLPAIIYPSQDVRSLESPNNQYPASVGQQGFLEDTTVSSSLIESRLGVCSSETVKEVMDRVEHLINIRTALVDAANGKSILC